MRRIAPRQAGFTLLEVLIAATLLAVMMTLLLGSLRIAVDSWSAGERRSTATGRMLVAANFLRTHLSAALPLFRFPAPGRLGSDGSGDAPQFLFRGGQDRLQYAGTLPPQVRGGLYSFDLYWQKVDDRSDLKLAIWPLSPLNGGKNAEPIDDVTILENVESFSITYFNARELDDKPSKWLNDWTEERMPALIRVEITVEGEPDWPPLIIAPKIEGRR